MEILVTLCLILKLGLVLSVPIYQDTKLCHKCPPGYFDNNNCMESNQPTSCVLCPKWKFSSYLDYSTECIDCTTVFGCDASQTLLRNCTTKHDSLCGCKNHEIFDINGICRINHEDFYVINGMWCRKCPSGFYVAKDCTEDGTNSSCLPYKIYDNMTHITTTKGYELNSSDNHTDFYLINGMWCRKCPPGFYVAKDCTEDGTNSSCLPCNVYDNKTHITTTKRYDLQVNSTENHTVVIVVATLVTFILIVLFIGLGYIKYIKNKGQSYKVVSINNVP